MSYRMGKQQHSRFRKFIEAAFFIWENNPRFNLSAVCTVIGLSALGLCAVIETFGIGIAPMYIIEVGKASFYFGIGGAYQKTKLEGET